MIIEREDNSALYFIVGALLIAVAAFAIYYFSVNGNSNSDVAADSTRVENTAPAAGETNSMSLSVDSNGAKATTQTQQ
jgi:hypothetical protein